MGHVINLHEYKSIGNHWIALYVNGIMNIFQKKLKNSQETKLSKQTFTEYKHTIR